MTTHTRHETTIAADPKVPTIAIVREFDAPVDRVYRAWTDPELVVQWIGPRASHVVIDRWDLRTGGAWRYTDRDQGFYGSFHEVRPGERLVQTFTWEGAPDGVSLETLTFEPLDGGRCRTRALSVVESVEIRDMIIASGMDVGVIEGYEKLDELLASVG